jgi:hypothetical protein
MKFSNYVNILKSSLALHNYNNRISSTQLYDNFQIFLPVDESFYHGPINLTGRNSLWWTIHHMGELLIPLFRFALIQNIPLRGCISIGKFFQTNKQILGPAVDEAS